MKTLKNFLHSREFALFGILVFLILFFAITVDGFFDFYNILDRSRHWVEIGLLAIPMTFIITTGGIDLSVGSMVAMCGILFGVSLRDLGLPLPMAISVGLSAGLVAGLLNGFVSVYLRIPPLVVTLASMTLFRGVAMGVSKADPVRHFPENFLFLGQGTVGEIPVQLFILVLFIIIGFILMKYSWIGRVTTAIGENEKAATFSAMPVRPLKMWLYGASGLVAGIAALIHTARFTTAHPSTAAGLELEVITCVVIGGTSISGGSGSIWGTVIGLLIIGFLRFGLDMAEFPHQQQSILIGFILILTVVINELLNRSGSRQRAKGLSGVKN